MSKNRNVRSRTKNGVKGKGPSVPLLDSGAGERRDAISAEAGVADHDKLPQRIINRVRLIAMALGKEG